MKTLFLTLCLISVPAYADTYGACAGSVENDCVKAIGEITANVLGTVSISDSGNITVSDGYKFYDCQFQGGVGYVCSF